MTSPSPIPLQPVPYPTTDERAEWKAYWNAQGQPWRTEPQIEKKRQKFLTERLTIVPNIEQSVYPFADVTLTRADVEWLLANHEDGCGPIDWSDEQQHRREGLDLRGARLDGENLSHLPLARLRTGITWIEWNSLTPEQIDRAAAHMQRVNLREAHLEGAILCHTNLQGAALYGVHLEDANVSEANMVGTVLYGANLERADLRGTHLEQAYLFRASLIGANLQDTFFDAGTNLEHVKLCREHEHVGVALADVHWGSANLSVIDWSTIHELGDEYEARHHKLSKEQIQDKEQRQEGLERYQTAVRANRQLTVALQTQGMNEDAARFAYRAQRLQRDVLWLQRRFGQFLLSLLLDLLAGYGYKPIRSFIAYLFVILGFATAYYLIGPHVHVSLTPLEAIVFSMTSFHGRGFSPGQGITLSNPLTVLAAIEAFVGLTIEVTFIATLTQRLFGK